MASISTTGVWRGHWLPALTFAILVAACGGGENAPILEAPVASAPASTPEAPPAPPSPSAPAQSFKIGGSVDGLVGDGLVLQLNGTTELNVSSDGRFQFDTPLPEGSSYSVTILRQPRVVTQTCTLDAAQGAVPAADVPDVTVRCAARPAKFLYTFGGTGLHPYLFNDLTGELTPAPATRILTPVGLVVHPTKPFAYVSDSAQRDIDSFALDETTGQATAGTSLLVNGATPPFRMQVDPTGRFLYGFLILLYSETRGYSIDPISGALANLPDATQPAGALVRSMGFHPSGRFLYMAPQGEAKVTAFAVNQSSGALLPVAGPSVVLQGRPQHMTVDPKGRFVYAADFQVAANRTRIEILAIDAATGALTPSTELFDVNSSEMVAEPSGRFLYSASNSNVMIYKIDPVSGQLTPGDVSQVTSANGNITGMAVDPTGRFLYAGAGNGIDCYAIDPVNGSLVPAPVPRTAAAGGATQLTFKQ